MGCGSVSNATAYWKQNGTPVVVSNQMQRWEGDYVAGVKENGSAFKNLVSSSQANAPSGSFEWSYDIVSADFSNTAASNGSANVGYYIRGKSALWTYDCGLRLRYEGGMNVTNHFVVNGITNRTDVYADADQIQVIMRSADVRDWTVVTNIPGNSVSDLHLRMVYNIDEHLSWAYMSVGEGSEVLLHSGTMQPDWALTQLRQGIQSGNGGNSWQPGDVVMVDNIELFQLDSFFLPPPTQPVLDLWTFDGLANGAALSEAVSTGYVGGVTFAENALASITNDMLRFAPHPNDTSLFRNATPSICAGATTCVYEVSWDVVSVDFSHTASVSSNGTFGFEIRDTAHGNNALGSQLKYNGTDDEISVTLKDASGEANVLVIPGSVASNIGVRLVFDLDQSGTAGSLYFYYTYKGAAVGKYDGAVHADFQLDQYRLRCQTINGGNGWQDGDEAFIDNLRIKHLFDMPITPEEYYVAWVDLYRSGMGANTNLGDHADNDGFNNLWEYAFGGDPINASDLGNQPMTFLIENGGTRYIDYVYLRRKDQDGRALTYSIKLNTNLLSGAEAWTNDTSQYATSVVDVNSEWTAVSNRLDTTEFSEYFIRLQVELQP
jgi:hypothetical protein